MTDTTSADACRDEFEKYCRESYEFGSFELRKGLDGSYCHEITCMLWDMWNHEVVVQDQTPQGFDRIIVEREHHWQMPKYKCRVCGRDDFKNAHQGKVHICDKPAPQAQPDVTLIGEGEAAAVMIHETCCCGECKPNERTIGVVSREEYAQVFNLLQNEKKRTAEAIAAARAEEREKCAAIAYAKTLGPVDDYYTDGFSDCAKRIYDEIKALAAG